MPAATVGPSGRDEAAESNASAPAAAPTASTSGSSSEPKLQPKNQPPKSERKSAAATVLAGATSGALVSAMVQPLDVVRTRMQAQSVAGAPVLSVRDTMMQVIREGGIRGLWKGTAPTVLRLGAGAGLHFLLLNALHTALETRREDGTHELSPGRAALSGGLARGAAAALLCPLTVIKTKMEYTVPGQAPQYQTVSGVTRGIVQSQGVAGLWRGLAPTILTNAPFSAIYYMCYTQLRAKARPLQEELGTPQFVTNFVAGTSAAIAATIATQPADVVRTRIQLGLGRGSMSPHHRVIAVTQELLKQGPQAWLTGATPRVFKRTLQTALVWTLYEELVPRITALGVQLLAMRDKESDAGIETKEKDASS